MVEGDFKGRFKVIDIENNNLILNPGGIVNYRFKKINYTPSICNNKITVNRNYVTNFKSFWQTFNDNYAFFDKRKINWNEIYRKYIPKIEEIKTEKEFAMILNEIITKFQDGHINLEIPISIIEKAKSSKKKKHSISKKQIQSDIVNKYIENPKSYNRVITWGKLKNKNIGYIGISDMNDFANYVPEKFQNSDKFDSIFNSVKNLASPLEYFQDEVDGVNKILPLIKKDLDKTHGIILDLRFNGGGYETVALELLSHFINEERKIISIKAKKKNGFTSTQNITLRPKEKSTKEIYLFTSPFTASAAEIFALGSLYYPNFKIYGSKSSGIFSEILWKELPIGWEFSLSNEIYLDPTGKIYEGEGIPIDYKFYYSKNKFKFHQSFYSTKNIKDKLLENFFNSTF
ncbi:S41 family peptidase [Flavobacteriaceae bacterium XHP0103]|uniref:S41 family peptidase n=1 Tax=Marixanthotalea marina TaxID=2844359 RepID=UPI002989C0B4|nr:S41 family peptidase [Marixanthotalea marina]MBU3822540.1 S41 family peptidase [Marixanthotalea marina]